MNKLSNERDKFEESFTLGCRCYSKACIRAVRVIMHVIM